MEARDFYNKRIQEDPNIGSVQLMEEYAKHIIEINLCDGSPMDFDKNTVQELRDTHKRVVSLITWVNNR